jgi:hypothetical protein
MAFWKQNALWLVLLTLTVSVSAGSPKHEPRKINVQEARKLAYEAVKVHNPGADLSSTPRGDDPDFYFFAATWPNPAGSPVIGYFAVNPWTGDVWDEGCRRLESPSLKKLQAQIRKRFGFRKGKYLELRAKKPVC